VRRLESGQGVGRRLHQWVRTLLAAAAVSVPMAAQGQNITISGRVTTGGGSQPMGGATVSISELTAGTITDAEGRYRLVVAGPATATRRVTIVGRMIGYKPIRRSIALDNTSITQNFDLERDVLNLEQVIVTGTSDATSQKKTAFSVGVVDNVQLKEAPSVTPLGGLQGRVAGAQVTAGTGAPGTAPAIRLRGATSLTGRQDPLIIVDGTITRLSLSDINSEDIERVEVIKGAAASSLYGSDAANGVVQIFTKRGAEVADGRTTVTVRNEFGANDLRRTIPNNNSHNYQLNADGSFLLNSSGNRVPKTDGISDNPYPRTFDQLGQVFRPGQFMTNYVSVGQRKGNTNLSAAFQNVSDRGVINQVNGFRRQNFRVNLDVAVNDKVDLQFGSFFARSTAGETDDGGGIFFGLRFLEPDIDLRAPAADGTPFNPAIRRPPLSGNVNNPLYYTANRRVNNDRDRFTGSAKLRYRPRSWLTAEANVNYDRGNNNFKALTPFGYRNSVGAVSQGDLDFQRDATRAYNVGATVTSVLDFRNWFTNTTKLAWVYEDQENIGLGALAQALTLGGVPEFAAHSRDVTLQTLPRSFTQQIRNQNYFAITTFDIKDKLIVDALVRQDASSLFGADQRTRTFGRYSIAYRLSEDLKLPGIQEFKLRASRGSAGLRPVFDAQYEQFALRGGRSIKTTLGNRDLRPAFSTETEVGFNLNFLRDFTFEYSYSDKQTKDNILNVPVSAATGFDNRWINTGTLQGTTHEILIGAVLAQTRNFFWRANIAGDRTRQRITTLGVPAFLVGPDAGDANTRIFRIAPGETFGVLYGTKWIRTPQQLENAIASGRLGANLTPQQFKVNEEGFYVRATDHQTSNERPLRAWNRDGTALQQIGDVNPDFTLALNQQITWRGLTVTTVINWIKGGDIYNYTRQWPFNEQRDPDYDQRSKPAGTPTNPYANGRKPVAYYQTFYNNFDPNDYFVEKGTHVRLRELAVNYALPGSTVRMLGMKDGQTVRLGLVGRNLLTSTRYNGYDPEVSGPGGGNPFAYRVDYFTYPIFRTLTGMVEIGF